MENVYTKLWSKKLSSPSILILDQEKRNQVGDKFGVYLYSCGLNNT